MNTEDKRLDFTNVADACCTLETLRVVGSEENIGSSQLIPNNLKFDFLAFKSLRDLELTHLNISPETVTSLGILRSTLTSLTATQCGLKTISQLLLCDLVHSQEELSLDFVKGASHCWSQLLSLNIRNNSSPLKISLSFLSEYHCKNILALCANLSVFILQFLRL